MPRGINAVADIQSSTANGVLLNTVWDEWADVIRQYNASNQPLISALTFPVTELTETIVTGDQIDVELATEYGVPQPKRTTVSSALYGYDLKWYDVRRGYTHRYLQTVTSNQLDADLAAVLGGFDRLEYRLVMNQLFTNVNRQAFVEDANGNATATPIPVYSVWNGNDGQTPPPYGANTFTSSHSHAKTSGAATIDSQDVEDLAVDVSEHGYSAVNGSTLVLLANPAQVKAIRTWRANVTNSNGAVATYDFIPAQGQPGLIIGSSVLGVQQPASNFNGLNVVGSYAGVLIVEEPRVPANYVALFASGGSQVSGNVVGVREPTNPALRGVLQTPGDNAAVPLVQSFFERALGTGIRQRGAASLLQISAAASYTPPTFGTFSS